MSKEKSVMPITEIKVRPQTVDGTRAGGVFALWSVSAFDRDFGDRTPA